MASFKVHSVCAFSSAGPFLVSARAVFAWIRPASQTAICSLWPRSMGAREGVEVVRGLWRGGSKCLGPLGGEFPLAQLRRGSCNAHQQAGPTAQAGRGYDFWLRVSPHSKERGRFYASRR